MAAKKQTPVTYYLETAPGLEEVAWLELRRRFPDVEHVGFLYAKDEHGIVVFRYSGNARALFSLHMAESIYLLIAYLPDLKRGYDDLKRLSERMVRSGDTGAAINHFSRLHRGRPQTYRLEARKYGRHAYGRKEFRKSVARALDEADNWQRIQKDADVDIYAGVYGSDILVGMQLPAPRDHEVNAAQAAAILLAAPDAEARFVDPLCGHGDMLAERREAGPATLLLGGSTDAGGLRRAQRRLQHAATICRWTPAALPLASGSVDSMASRWPETSVATYAAWLGEIGRVLRPEGRAVILTLAYDAFRDGLRAVPALKIERGYSVRLPAGEEQRWGRLYIVVAA